MKNGKENDNTLDMQEFWLEYLNAYIFNGLDCLYQDSSPEYKYFSEEDFKIILDRITNQGIGILGMHTRYNEVWNMELFEWRDHEMSNGEWIRYAFNKLRTKRGHELHFMAVFYMIEKQIKRN